MCGFCGRPYHNNKAKERIRKRNKKANKGSEEYKLNCLENRKHKEFRPSAHNR